MLIKKLSNFLFKDIGWKIFAALSAIILWYVVMNIENPIQRQSVTKTLQLKNEDILKQNGFTLMNKETLAINVTMRVQGKRSDMSLVFNQSPSINAYIDLQTIDETFRNYLGDPIRVIINTTVPAGCEVRSSDPETAAIIIDELATKTLPVTVIPVGEVRENFEAQPFQYTLTSVELDAAQSVLDLAESVEVAVNIKNAEQDVEITDAELIVYDKSHKDMTDKVNLNVNRMHITVPVYAIKTIPIQASIEGRPENGFWVSGVSPEPQTVEIVGRSSDLDLLDTIHLAPVNLDSTTEDTQQAFDIRDYLVGTGASVRRDTPHEVAVTVHVEKETTRALQLSTQNISVTQSAEQSRVDLPAESVSYSVRGPAAAVNRINPEDVTADLDVSDLPAGTQTARLRIHLPQDVVLTNTPIHVQVVIHMTETPSPAVSETQQAESANSAAATTPARSDPPGSTPDPTAPKADSPSADSPSADSSSADSPSADSPLDGASDPPVPNDNRTTQPDSGEGLE